MSATPSERRALLFLAAVACLGVGVRATAAVRREPPRAEQRAALARQLAAVDSARQSSRTKRRGAGRGQSGGAVAKGKPTDAGRRRGGRPVGLGASETPVPAARSPLPVVVGIVDVDVAGTSELVALKGVGPALAARIVADRDSLGPFGSLEGLGRVRGVGPALLRKLQGRVTFSGTPRLPHDVRPPSRAGRATPSAASPSPPESHRPRRPRQRRR